MQLSSDHVCIPPEDVALVLVKQAVMFPSETVSYHPRVTQKDGYIKATIQSQRMTIVRNSVLQRSLF